MLSCCIVCYLQPCGHGKGLTSDIFCVFVTFPYSVLGQGWYLIIPISDLLLLPYFISLPSFVVGKGWGDLVCLFRTVCCIMEA